MAHVSPWIYLGNQKVCGVCMDPVLKLFDHPEGLNWPGTHLIGVVPTFMSGLTSGDRYHGAG
jgi:hypothetical protein